MKKSLLFCILTAFLLSGCMAKQKMAEEMESSYFGIAAGTYAKIYYRADESVLELSLENTTTAPMQNLVVVVRQVTAGGVDETQRSFRLLRIHTLQELSVPLAPDGTGEIGVDYYFVPAKLEFSGRNDQMTDQREFASDFVKFRVKR